MKNEKDEKESKRVNKNKKMKKTQETRAREKVNIICLERFCRNAQAAATTFNVLSNEK